MERTANFAESEKQILIALVDSSKSIIECKETNAVSIKEKQDTWVSIVEQFNANTMQPPRTVKQVKTLYFNLKRKVKKDVATEHKQEYLQRTKKVAAEDKREIHKTGGGTYCPKLNETGAQLLAVVAEQIEPLPNPFDDAAMYFTNTVDDDYNMQAEASSEPPPQCQPVTVIHTPNRRIQMVGKRNARRNLDYKKLYFKKKYEMASFELKSKIIMHNLDVKLKKKQLEKLCE